MPKVPTIEEIARRAVTEVEIDGKTILEWIKEIKKYIFKNTLIKEGADSMENINLNHAREKALLEIYKAIEVAAVRIDGTAQLAASAPSIMSLCESCVRLESIGKQDPLEKAYEKIFSMNKPKEAPMTQKTEGETGNDGSDSGASGFVLGY